MKLSLGDFVIKDAPSKGKNRRIKPTKVAEEPLKAIGGPMSAFQAPEQNMSFAEDRLALKMDCEAVGSKFTKITPVKVSISGNPQINIVPILRLDSRLEHRHRAADWSGIANRNWAVDA